MADGTPLPYQVAFSYGCQFCKNGHTEFGRLTQSGVAVTHREELKWRLLELIKEKFSEAHPKEKFDLGNLIVEEFVDGNKSIVDPQTIQPREVKGEDLTKPKEEEGVEGFLKKKIPEIEKILAPTIPIDATGIMKMVKERMKEIRKREKEIGEQVEKLTSNLESMNKELKELERLQSAAEEIAAKKPGTEKKK